MSNCGKYSEKARTKYFIKQKIKETFKKEKAEPIPSFPFTTFLGEEIKGPESYQEVRGLLAGDYQNYLEERWVARLRAASKVEINQEVLKTVNKH